jgi:hypothetical protein
MSQILNRRLRDAHISHPDGRRREHKAAIEQAYKSTIDELVEQLDKKCIAIKNGSNKIKRLQLKLRATGLTEEETLQDNTCLICMDDMDGKVTLRCGHEMCPDCFARHSRVNHTCPFCRDEFAPKVKIINKLPIESLDALANSWSVATRLSGYFNSQLSINRDHLIVSLDAAEDHLEWLVRENGKILMRDVKRWYDTEIN